MYSPNRKPVVSNVEPSAIQSLPVKSFDESVKLAGVLADDLVAYCRRQVAKLAFDELARVRPDAVGVPSLPPSSSR